MPKIRWKQLAPQLTVSSSLTSVSATTASTVLLAANANRVSFTITNASGATLYLRNNPGTATANACSVPMNSGGFYSDDAEYKGDVVGVWSSADGGAALITEYHT